MFQQHTAVILLNWNGWRDTIDCLESLLNLDSDVGVIICDNASTDRSIEHLMAWCETGLPAANARRAAQGRLPYQHMQADPPADALTEREAKEVSPETLCTITFIQTGDNLGFAGGNNVGLRYALDRDYGYFWILNNDTQPLPDALAPLQHRMNADPAIGMCGSTLVYMDRPDTVQCLGGGTFSLLKGRGAQIGTGSRLIDNIDGVAIEHKLRFVSGAAMLVSRGFLIDIGLMCEDYFIYYEEIDWAMRARGQYNLGYAPDSIVRHKVGASIGTHDFEERSFLSEYYMNRNRIIVLLKYSKLSLLFTFFDVIRFALKQAIQGRWARTWIILSASLQMPYNWSVRPSAS